MKQLSLINSQYNHSLLFKKTARNEALMKQCFESVYKMGMVSQETIKKVRETIYETQYKCTIRENEFNFSLNPSLISGSTDGTVYGYVTSSYFSPFVTTVGLYDENQNLLAVGKLSQPVPTSPTTDTTILINIDR